MRWAIGILLVLNITVLLWQGMQSAPSVEQPVPEPDVGNLRLLSERLPREVQSSTQPVIKPLIPAAIQVEPEKAAQRPAPSVPESRPSQPKPSPLAKREPPPVVPPKPEPAMICWEVGDYPGESQANTAVAALPAGSQVLEVVKVQERQVDGYYVLLPAADTQEEAKANLARLKNEGVTDTWLFRSGPLKNAISLGLFNNRVNAERHAARIRGKGFKTQLREKGSGEDIYRLRLKGPDSEATNRVLQKMSAGYLKEIPCI